jgi:hypothetical protein
VKQMYRFWYGNEIPVLVILVCLYRSSIDYYYEVKLNKVKHTWD